MRYKKVLPRRTFLRGSGSIAIGLPFLDEMRTTSVYATEENVGPRCLSLFFGLGMDRSQQLKQFDGPLEPHKPFADKMAMFTNVDMRQGSDNDAHFDAAACVFVGLKRRSKEQAGGPSVDQVFKDDIYANKAFPTLGTVSAGMWFRQARCSCQPQRSWRPDGSRAALPIKRPTVLFKRLFGDSNNNTPVNQTNNKIEHSILDTVVGEYQHYTSDASPLGATSKTKLRDHLEYVRALEQKLDQVDQATQNNFAQCNNPEAVSDPDLMATSPRNFSYDNKDGGTNNNSPAMSYLAFQEAYRVLADVYVLGLRCDLFRFGSLMYHGSGDHVKYLGPEYSALGKSVKFPTGNSAHDAWIHKGNGNSDNIMLFYHLIQTNMAYAIKLLDDKNHLEANGKTILDNSLTLMATETGWNHSLDNVFHAIVGGGGRFKPGFYNERVNAVDIYNTALKAFGGTKVMAQKHYNGELSSVLA